MCFCSSGFFVGFLLSQFPSASPPDWHFHRVLLTNSIAGFFSPDHYSVIYDVFIQECSNVYLTYDFIIYLR